MAIKVSKLITTFLITQIDHPHGKGVIWHLFTFLFYSDFLYKYGFTFTELFIHVEQEFHSPATFRHYFDVVNINIPTKKHYVKTKTFRHLTSQFCLI